MPDAIVALGPLDAIHRIMWGDVLELPLPPAVHDAIRTVLAAEGR